MNAKRNRLTAWFVLMSAIVCSGALAGILETGIIEIGHTKGMQGQTVSVPLTLDAAEYLTAALVRVQYDPVVLENPSLTAGALFSGDHVLDSHSPEAGRINVMIYSASGMPALTNRTGTLCSLNFDIKSDAPYGESPITITTSGTPELPALNLANLLGFIGYHYKQAGSVTVSDSHAGANHSWILYE